jgi:hypothetical protein
MYDQGVIKEYKNLKHNSKQGVKMQINGLMDQHINATCHMQSLEKDFYLDVFDS